MSKLPNTEVNLNAQIDYLDQTDLTELKNYEQTYSLDPEEKELISKILRTTDHLKPNLQKGLLLFAYRVLNSKIVNGVAPLTTGKFIDIDRIVEACIKNKLSYKVHEKFSGLPVRFTEQGLKFTAVFFKSGKINLIGLKADQKEHLTKVIKILAKYELDFFGEPRFHLVTKRFANRVYALSIPKVINLNHLHLFNELSCWKRIKYNSQTFPGVVLRFEKYKAKALFFKTGSIIFTGIVSKLCKLGVLNQVLDVLLAYLKQLNSRLPITQ